MRQVFLLGAGFSKAINSSMPLLSDLTRYVRDTLLIPREVLRLGNDLELWMSYLHGDQPWLTPSENLRNHALALDVASAVSQEVATRTLKATMSPCPQWLLRLVSYWDVHRSDVLTLNYDTLVERAATEVQPELNSAARITAAQIYGIPVTPSAARTSVVLGPSKRDTFKLHKLHGSVNWFYSGRPSFCGETIVFVPPVAWSVVTKAQLKDQEQTFLRATIDKTPLIIPPLSTKGSYFENESLRLLWRLAGEALRDADEIIVMGYSLPATDFEIPMFVKSRIVGRKVTVRIVDLEPPTAIRFMTALGGRSSKTTQSHFGIDAIEAYVAEYCDRPSH